MEINKLTSIESDTAVPVVADTGEPVYRVPLGIFKQAMMKIESAVLDLHEIKEDEELDPADKPMIEAMIETMSIISANIINIIKKEMDEDDFLAEDFAMDEIGTFPGDEVDILDQSIES